MCAFLITVVLHPVGEVFSSVLLGQRVSHNTKEKKFNDSWKRCLRAGGREEG